MLILRKTSLGLWQWLLLGLLLTVLDSAMAEFKIAQVRAQIVEQSLKLNATLELGLSDKAEEALSKGIPLEVSTAVYLNQIRQFWWDKQIALWSLRHKIRYHALSGQYLVSGSQNESDDVESFTSLQEALKYMGAINDISLPLSVPLTDSDAQYEVQLRTTLDIETLPAPLRPVAYTSPAWHLSSGWSSWKVQP